MTHSGPEILFRICVAMKSVDNDDDDDDDLWRYLRGMAPSVAVKGKRPPVASENSIYTQP